MRKRLFYILISSFVSAGALAGTCKVSELKVNGIWSKTANYTAVRELDGSYLNCVDAALEEFAKHEKPRISASYVTDSHVQVAISVMDGKFYQAMVPTIHFSKDQYCFARADYKSLLRGTFANANGLVLVNQNMARPADCIKSATDAYIMASAQGVALRAMNAIYWIKGDVLVSTDITTSIQDASILNNLLNEQQ